MSRPRPSALTFLARAALSAIAVGAFTGVAFAAWIDSGSVMLMTLAASGMSWCF